MTSLLSIASGFLEQLASPRVSRAEHDAASERLALLLTDERVRARFETEVTSLSEPDELSAESWYWVLGYVAANRLELNPDLLSQLCLRWPSTSLVVRAINARIQSAEGDDSSVDSVVTWLAAVVGQLRVNPAEQEDRVTSDDAVGQPDTFDPGEPTSREFHSQQAEIVFWALLAVGHPAALVTARTMLLDSEQFNASLQDAWSERLELLDPATREAWLRTVGLQR